MGRAVTSVTCVLETVGILVDERLSSCVVSLCLWENAKSNVKQIITMFFNQPLLPLR